MFDRSLSGHVCILGCTNVGKSTLFNSLLMSDYCKETAIDYIKRATTSLWPGRRTILVTYLFNINMELATLPKMDSYE